MKYIYTFIIYLSSIYFFINNNNLNIFLSNILNKLFIFLLLLLINIFINISIYYINNKKIIFLSIINDSLIISLIGLLSYILFIDIYNIYLYNKSKFINTGLLSFFISSMILFYLIIKKYFYI
jgi:hypothetical protein